MQAWSAHVQGAIQLLEIRGASQFCTGPGRDLYRMFRTHAVRNNGPERQPSVD